MGQRRPRKNQSGQGSCCLQTQPKQMSNPPSLSWKCCYGCRWLKMEGNSLMCCKSTSRTLAACRCIRLCTLFCNPRGRLMTTGKCQAIFKQVRNSHGRFWKELGQGHFCMTAALCCCEILFPNAGTSSSKNCVAASLAPPPHHVLLGSERNHKGSEY